MLDDLIYYLQQGGGGTDEGTGSGDLNDRNRKKRRDDMENPNDPESDDIGSAGGEVGENDPDTEFDEDDF